MQWNIQQEIRVNTLRLRRSFESSSMHCDEAALRDLAHSLRMFVDMRKKGHLQQAGARARGDVSLETVDQNYFFLHMSREVTVAPDASRKIAVPSVAVNNIFSLSRDAFNDFNKAYYSFRMNSGPPLSVTSGEFLATFGLPPEDAQGLPFNSSDLSRRSTPLWAWLDAPLITVRFHDSRRVRHRLQMSRKEVVERVANHLGGSHPAGEAPRGKRDEALHVVLGYRLLGLPLPFFALMEVASGLLETLPNLYA
jgi:hypothetical protein